MSVPSFCTVSDVKRILRTRSTVQESFVVIGTDGDVTEDEVSTEIETQSDYIIRRLGFTPAYSSGVPPIIRRICEYLVAYNIYLRVWTSAQELRETIPEQIKEWKLIAEELLDKIINGEIAIEPETSEDRPSVLLISSDIERVEDEQVTLKLSSWASLNLAPVVPNSERVASAKLGGGTIYTRNTDYEILYREGKIRRLSGGSIAENTKVYITYLAEKERPDAVRRTEG